MDKNSDLMVEIGRTLKRLRQSKGLTQVQLGELIGSPQGTITRLETAAVSDTHIGLLEAITRALDTGLDEFFCAVLGSKPQSYETSIRSHAELMSKLEGLSEAQQRQLFQFIDAGLRLVQS